MLSLSFVVLLKKGINNIVITRKWKFDGTFVYTGFKPAFNKVNKMDASGALEYF